jgi:hypothetical protein
MRRRQLFAKWGFFGKHPKHYHMTAIVLALVVASAAVAAITSAEDTTFSSSTTSSGTSTPTTTAVSCSYSYGSWGACQTDSKRYRFVTGITPSGCLQTQAPNITESCTYIAPVTSTPTLTTTTTSSTLAPQCAYAYSGWGACQSDNTQSRTLASSSPSGCEQYLKPILKQNCLYTASITAPTTTTPAPTTATTSSVTSTNSTSTNTASSTLAPQCVYTYSGWGACQSNGKRVRTTLSKSPTGCQAYLSPVIEQSCIYDTAITLPVASTTSTPTQTSSSTQTSSTTNGASVSQTTQNTNSSTGNVTPTFSFSNVSSGMIIQGSVDIRGEVQGAKSVEFYLVPVGSNTDKYIGAGSKISETGWSFQFDSKEFPNGESYLRANITNAYGAYGSEKRKVYIVNNSQSITVATTANDGSQTFKLDDTLARTILQQAQQDIQIPQDANVDTTTQTISQQRARIVDYCQSNPQSCFPDRDSDQDGLSDIDEIRYGTDPHSADTDLDGFNDGDEVKNGFDPLKYSAGDKSDRVVFESPKNAGVVKKDIYEVRKVEMKGNSAGANVLHLTGKGLPNSFVTIYVYSDPIVLTVKTDSEGNWTYDLDKNLEDGQHEAYVAITDNTGKITAKSDPIAFVKTAQAVTVIPSAQGVSDDATLPVIKHRTQRDIFFLITIVFAALAVALATIGLIKHRRMVARGEIVRIN